MSRTYEIYLSSSKYPAYTYKTNAAFYSRLRYLAALRALDRVYVWVSDINKSYIVWLNPSPDVTWSSYEMGSNQALFARKVNEDYEAKVTVG